MKRPHTSVWPLRREKSGTTIRYAQLIVVARHISRGFFGPLAIIREMALASIPQPSQSRIFAALPLTLVYRLHRRALEQPEQVADTFLTYNSTDVEKQSLTYKELDERALAVSAELHRRGATGKPVLLFFPAGLDYIAAYFGCLYAGSIAIPAYVPLPGASNVDEFWQNVRAGIESIAVFTPEELLAAGADAEAIQHPDYVRARLVLRAEEVECFDAEFFGYTPREAALTDPRHRVFLECAYEALQDAAYDLETYPGLIGVFGGSALSPYFVRGLTTGQPFDDTDMVQISVANERDSLASAISYKLDLRGPSLGIQPFSICQVAF